MRLTDMIAKGFGTVILGIILSLFTLNTAEGPARAELAPGGPPRPPVPGLFNGNTAEQPANNYMDEAPSPMLEEVNPTEANLPESTYKGYVAIFVIGSDIYYINNASYIMDVKPYISRGRSFVPVRYLAYACGLGDTDIDWTPSTHTVNLEGRGGVLRMRVGSNIVYYNDSAEIMDVCPEIRGGRVCLPALYVATFMGYNVAWDAGARSISIYD